MPFDTLIILILFFFFILGWLQGFWRTIIGPIALIIGSFIAYNYYNETHNLLGSLAVGIVAPFLLKIIFSVIVKSLQKAKNNEAPLISFGRFCGGLFNVSWSGTMLILTLIIIMLMPGHFPGLKFAQNYVGNSKTYEMISRMTNETLADGKWDIKKVTEMLQDPKKLEVVSSLQEYKDLMSDVNIKKILEDKDLLKHIQENNIGEILKSKKMHAIIEDEDTVQKIFHLNTKILEQESASAASSDTTDQDHFPMQN